MAFETRDILETFSVHELKALAAEAAVDVAGCESKEDYATRLAASEAVQGRLQAPTFRVRPLLAAKSTAVLKALAEEHRVDVSGCKRKWDFVERLAASPAAAKILEGTVATSTLDLGHAAADRLIEQGRNQDVDFGLVEDILDQSRMRYEERDYDRSLELAREALLLAHGTLDAFERASWAYALLASQRLIEESGRVGRDVDPAASLLRDAKVVFVSGNLAANEGLLMKLQTATKALYSEEVQRLRQTMYAVQDKIGQGRHVGGDVAAADDALARARDSMRRAEHAKAFSLLKDADRLAGEAIGKRVKDIEAMIPEAEKSIGDARGIGADVEEAARLLEKAKVALERGEHVLAIELVQRSERATLQSQHYQFQRAVELRTRQTEKAQRLADYLVPIVDEAASYDLPIEEPRRLLAEAREVLNQGDYVNGTVLAKQADEILRTLVPRLVEERGKRGIVKPPAGKCGVCDAADTAFLDDGWSRCNACGATWRWRAPSGLWERFRSLLRE